LPPKNPSSASNGATQAKKDSNAPSASKPPSATNATSGSGSATASPVPAPATTSTTSNAPMTTPMSGAGILRPGRSSAGASSLFTYTPLPHPPANMSESGK
jgi:hypothetical protein